MIKKISLKVKKPKNKNYLIDFGIAEENDMDEVYRLRFNVYSQRGYINSKRFPDGKEFDHYDVENKSIHFIAKIENKIIACVRIIKDIPLPTEIFFSFSPQKLIEEIDPKNRCELGRLIIIPPSKEKKEYLPRGLVMLLLFSVLADYGIENNLKGGYSFVKNSLEIKMSKRKMPFKKIDIFEINYPDTGVLYNYFNQKNDSVIPIFFVTQDFINYTQRFINNKFLFKRQDKKNLILRSNFYVKILQFLKFI